MKTLLCLSFCILFLQVICEGRSSGTIPTRWFKHVSQAVSRSRGSPSPARQPANGPGNVVCYYPWRGPKDLTLDKANTSYCSHVITGFATVGTDGKVDPGLDKDIYKQVAAFKSKQPGLKVLLSVGGGGSTGFPEVVSTPEARDKFIRSILDLLNECNLDGLDVDWEFPVWNSPLGRKDKPNFVLFLRDFRAAIANTSLLLSAAVAAQLPVIMASYDVPGIAQYVDFINLMTYDFHIYKPFEDPFTGFNSPLFPRKVEKAYFATLNLAWAAEYWVKIGMPREKVMVGIPTYAHVYALANATMTWPDAPAVGNLGDWSYSGVCDIIKAGAKTNFDPESLVPYAWKDLQWFTYENDQSVTEKAKWIKANGFGGAMTFDLNTDDWQKSCGSEDFPLHKIIHTIITS